MKQFEYPSGSVSYLIDIDRWRNRRIALCISRGYDAGMTVTHGRQIPEINHSKISGYICASGIFLGV